MIDRWSMASSRIPETLTRKGWPFSEPTLHLQRKGQQVGDKPHEGQVEVGQIAGLERVERDDTGRLAVAAGHRADRERPVLTVLVPPDGRLLAARVVDDDPATVGHPEQEASSPGTFVERHRR